MTEAYAVNCAALCQESMLQKVYGLLDKTRQARVRRLRVPQKRAQCAAAGMLLRHLFGSETIAYAGNGKPYLQNKPATHFNLAHTGNWVFCAVSHVPVGVDAQVLTAYKERLAKRWFTPEEQLWIREEPSVRFTRLWTQKEAYAKMTGEGIVKAVTGNTIIQHFIKEYDDFADENIYITVCAKENIVFPPAIVKITEPLW